MKTTERFDNAITKLYNAFHKGELNALNCKACAVGNICDNKPDWRYSGRHDYLPLEEGILFGYKPVEVIEKTGYSVIELANIEYLFMYGVKRNELGLKFRSSDNKKETQFKGLCAVVEYLCELDNIPNIMEVQSLFEYENETPKNKLTEVLISQ